MLRHSVIVATAVTMLSLGSTFATEKTDRVDPATNCAGLASAFPIVAGNHKGDEDGSNAAALAQQAAKDQAAGNYDDCVTNLTNAIGMVSDDKKTARVK